MLKCYITFFKINNLHLFLFNKSRKKNNYKHFKILYYTWGAETIVFRGRPLDIQIDAFKKQLGSWVTFFRQFQLTGQLFEN